MPGAHEILLPMSGAVATVAGDCGRIWPHPWSAAGLARLRTQAPLSLRTSHKGRRLRPAHAQSNTQAVSRGVVRSSARKPPSLGKCASSSTALVVASTVVVVTSHTSKATENKRSGG